MLYTCTSWYAYAATFGSSNQVYVTNTCSVFIAWPYCVSNNLWLKYNYSVHRAKGHEATDTGLAYAPVSQAHGHHHTQFNVLPCCTAAQTSSVPSVALHSPLQVAIESS